MSPTSHQGWKNFPIQKIQIIGDEPPPFNIVLKTNFWYSFECNCWCVIVAAAAAAAAYDDAAYDDAGDAYDDADAGNADGVVLLTFGVSCDSLFCD